MLFGEVDIISGVGWVVIVFLLLIFMLVEVWMVLGSFENWLVFCDEILVCCFVIVELVCGGGGKW